MYSNWVEKEHYSKRSLHVVKDNHSLKKPFRQEELSMPQKNHSSPKLSIISTEAELSLPAIVKTTEIESESNGVLKEATLERNRTEREEKKNKLRMTAKLAEQKRIKKLVTIEIGVKPIQV